MDIIDTIQANSQQINADDLTGAPRTVTITNVEAGTAEQPVFIHVAEFPGRTYRPGKSMRRILVAAWGSEASVYVGRSLTLYNDPTIKFGKDVTGGIRISHMTHLDKPLQVALTVTRGKRAPFTVQPLTIAPTTPAPSSPDRVAGALQALNTSPTLDALDSVWHRVRAGGLDNDPTLIAAYEQRATELTEAPRG